jgi:hypothetical protein
MFDTYLKFNGIYTLPICPRCKDTKYVVPDPALSSRDQICSRCSIKWNIYGRVDDFVSCVNKMTSLKYKIKQEAERLWSEAGKPEGRDKEFWLAAEKNVL